MREYAVKERRQRILQSRRDFEAKLDAVRERERKIRQRAEKGEPVRKRRKVEEGPTKGHALSLIHI